MRFLIDSIEINSIGLSLHIYRPGKTYPFTSRFTKGNLYLNLYLLGLQTQTGQADRSDRSASVHAKFGCQ